MQGGSALCTFFYLCWLELARAYITRTHDVYLLQETLPTEILQHGLPQCVFSLAATPRRSVDTTEAICTAKDAICSKMIKYAMFTQLRKVRFLCKHDCTIAKYVITRFAFCQLPSFRSAHLL